MNDRPPDTIEFEAPIGIDFNGVMYVAEELIKGIEANETDVKNLEAFTQLSKYVQSWKEWLKLNSFSF
jgi:hypothetical protein